MEKNKSLKYLLIVEAFLLFCASRAYFFWFSNFFTFLTLLAALFPVIVSINKLEVRQVVISLLFSLLFAIHVVVIGGSMTFVFYLAIIPLYLLVPSKLKVDIIDFYVLKVFPVLLGISVLTYFLEGFDITHLPVFPVRPINTEKSYYYISHFFFLQDSDSLSVFSRFNSYYEECGVIGTMIVFFLFSHGDRMPIWVKTIYILAGFLTVSLFFYVMIIIYLFLEVRHIRNKKWNAVLMVLLSLAAIYLIFSLFDSDFIDTFIYNRFLYEDGVWSGDDRAGEWFKNYFWNDFIHSDAFWFGTSEVKNNGWSIYRCIVENGVVIVSLTIGLYAYCFLRNRKNKKRWIYLVVFLAAVYQRPEFWSIFNFVFFMSVSEYVGVEETDKEQIKGKLSFISKT